MCMSNLARAVVISGVVALSVLVDTAAAQFVPYSRYGGYGWGRNPSALPSPDAVLADRGRDRRQIMAQTSRQQRDRNQFLVNQSRRNTAWTASSQQSMEQARMSQARSRQQQFASRSGTYLPTTPVGPPPREPAATPPRRTPLEPPAQVTEPLDTKRWPTLLEDPRFSEPRATLERLLAKAEATNTSLAVFEYRMIVDAAEEMKEILRGMAHELNAAEFLLVQQFLDGIISDYQSKANPPR